MEKRPSRTNSKQGTLGEHLHHLGSPFCGSFWEDPSNLVLDVYMDKNLVKIHKEQAELVSFVKEMVRTKHGVDLGLLTLNIGGKTKVGLDILDCLTLGNRFKEGWFFLCLACGNVSSAHAPTRSDLNNLNHAAGSYACYNTRCSVCNASPIGTSIQPGNPGVRQATTFHPLLGYPLHGIALRSRKKIIELRNSSNKMPEVDIVCPPLKAEVAEVQSSQKDPEEILKRASIIGSSLILENGLPEEISYMLEAMCILVGIDDREADSMPQDKDAVLCLLCELALCVSDLLVFIDTTSFMADSNAVEDVWYNTPVKVPNMTFSDILNLTRDVMLAVMDEPDDNFMYGDFSNVSVFATSEIRPLARGRGPEEMRKLLGVVFRKFLVSIYRASKISSRKEIMYARLLRLTESARLPEESLNPNLVSGALLIDFSKKIVRAKEPKVFYNTTEWGIALERLYIQPTVIPNMVHTNAIAFQSGNPPSSKTISGGKACIIHRSISEYDNVDLASLRYIMLTTWDLFAYLHNRNPRHDADQSHLGSMVRESVSSNRQKRKQDITRYKKTLNELLNEP